MRGRFTDRWLEAEPYDDDGLLTRANVADWERDLTIELEYAEYVEGDGDE